MMSFYDFSQQLPTLDVGRTNDQKGDWSLNPIDYLEIGIRPDLEDGYLPNDVKEKLDLSKKKIISLKK